MQDVPQDTDPKGLVSSHYSLCELDETDYEAILALLQQAGLHVRPAGRDAPDAFTRQMAEKRQRVIGLRDGSQLVAVAVLTHDGRKGWINRLAVDLSYRRQGLASRLIAEAERWFVEDAGLEVWAALIENHNAASLALFEALDYQKHDLTYVRKKLRPEA